MLGMGLQPGEFVLFCADGITEAFNIEDESFGVLRLKSLCENALRTPPRELLRRIFAAVEAFTLGREQYDDMAAAVFHYGLLTPINGAYTRVSRPLPFALVLPLTTYLP